MHLNKTSITGSFIVRLFFILIAAYASAQISPEMALKQLMDGNERYVQEAPLHPNRGEELRGALVSTQKPFAIIVGCSDSRAAPEIVFDQGVGDLFVVRVAGNVIGPLGLDSIEYSALYLDSSVILVMGHENCGAVDAVIQGTTKDIESVANLIRPAVQQAKKEGNQDLLYRATVDNAIRMKKYLLRTPVIKKLVSQGKIQVHAGYYNFQSGKVDLVDNQL